MNSTETLFEQLGGAEGIKNVVSRFYDKVLADERINEFFKHTDMEKQIRHQSLFISWVTGGPNQYSGKSMAKAHEGMNLQEGHFIAVAEDLSASLREFGVTENQISQVIEKLLTMKDEILHK